MDLYVDLRELCPVTRLLTISVLDIPFNGGPRICIGQQFALTEIGYTTVRILQKFSRLENTSSVVPKLKADIVLQPSDGVDVIFHE